MAPSLMVLVPYTSQVPLELIVPEGLELPGLGVGGRAILLCVVPSGVRRKPVKERVYRRQAGLDHSWGRRPHLLLETRHPWLLHATC